MCSMMWRSVLEMITSRSPAFFARWSAGMVSGNGCQLCIARSKASISFSFQR